jgi:predicted phage gp36 major capsid-like protein
MAHGFTDGSFEMRAIISGAVAIALILGGAAAAQQPADAHKNAAVKSPDTTGAPTAGANSFTKGQAEGRLKKAGYTNITSLEKDKDGLWHAQAMKDGKQTTVSLDFKGDVNPQ